MKKLCVSFCLLFVFALILYSCNLTSSVDEKTAKDVKEKITYVKDSTTGLCFGMVNSTSSQGYNVVSITCVPCDSLKKVGIK